MAETWCACFSADPISPESEAGFRNTLWLSKKKQPPKPSSKKIITGEQAEHAHFQINTVTACA